MIDLPVSFWEMLNEVAEECHQNANRHGFWPTLYNFGEKIALMHSELSEALEVNRKGQDDEPDEKCPAHSKLECELADVIIRVFDLAGALGLDIGGAVKSKMLYNESRPMKHGKAY